ncbi:sodium/potassium/calcium exchanger 4 isoform X1 [Drosophila mauritiana]|uniref:Sodium/potassium/calcium exchanger 4 isoform X1 n=1 Tax=Drosophila mauritiana TaxID=7226 RepID=A0A6P8KTU3_DROMA|nr:sodium/potassium/calcium exchanger 4 isoform X1 [Drosophila mauritiana]
MFFDWSSTDFKPNEWKYYPLAYRHDMSYDIDALNCTLPAIVEFPNLMRQKSWIAIVVSSLVSMYLFVILAIVCDDYLVPAMERLCYTLRMTYDVAGATFLAASTSAPELFVNFVGTFVTNGDIGLGTIVGSSVFNVLVIAGVCGIFTQPSKLDWWPVTRDTAWYLIAIASLTYVLYDSLVTWYEAFAFLLLYIAYVIQLSFDRRIQNLVRHEHAESELLDEDPMTREEEPLKGFRDHVCAKPQTESNFYQWTWWAVKYPAELMLACTVPSVRSIFFLSMILAVLWISLISYLLAWFLTILGYNLKIPDAIMGLTVLAAGTSVPEVASSYIVSKKGYGSMAICNAIGSNTFDIFICLGLPWLLKILIYQQKIEIDSTALTITTAMLVITAAVLYLGLLASRFVMGKIVGYLSIIFYVLFLIIACTLEILLNKENMCDIEDPSGFSG